MCRLLLAINQDNSRCIDLFIKLGTIDKKLNRVDGYGLSWENNEKISSYVSSIPYFQDKEYHNVVLKLINDEPNVILGHIRNKSDASEINPSCNNQPFRHNSEDITFVHNGKIVNFMKYKSFILQNIDKKYIAEIKGTTDSELIMLLYLTIIKKNTHHIYNKKIMKISMKELIHFFESNLIPAILNIICIKNDDIVICRHTVLPGKQNNHPSLYIYEKKNEILVTTQKLSHNQSLIKRNSILMRSK